MYSNIFDTVRNSPKDWFNFEAMLYTSVIGGKHPVFSLNQVVDSTALLGLTNLYAPFCELIKDGTMRVAQHKFYIDEKTKQPIDAITGYLIDALKPKKEETEELFRFSCLPFLYSGKYGAQDIQNIYNYMLNIILDNQPIIRPKCCSDEHLELIKNYLQTVLRLKRAVSGRYISPPTGTGQKKALSDRLYFTICRLGIEFPKSDVYTGLCEVQKQIETSITEKERPEQDRNRRSSLYSVIEATQYSNEAKTEMKAIVDLCYNETVAASISDGEDDIMAVEDSFHNIRVISENDALETSMKKLALVQCSRAYQENSWNWDVLKEILDQANGDLRFGIPWEDSINRACRSKRIETIKVTSMGMVQGAFQISTKLAKIIMDYRMATSDLAKDWENPVMLVMCGAAALGDAANLVETAYNTQKTVREGIGKLKALNQAKSLIVQTEMLKHDYGGGGR